MMPYGYKASSKSRVRYRSLSEDPTKGIRYNEFLHHHRSSKRVLWVDVASNPNVIKEVNGEYVRMNVQNMASRINGEQYLINYEDDSFKGR